MPTYKDTSASNKLKQAGAATLAKSIFAGFALNDGADGQPLEYGYGEGELVIGGTGVTVGQVYVVSNTDGAIAPYSDLSSGQYVTYLGIGKTTSSIQCNPHSSQIVKP